MITNKQSRTSCPLFWVAVAAFVFLVIFLNPLRETPIADDWSYALTVRHLLDTGNYRLHDWAAANFPFQAYWGALFAKIFGFSFVSLRFSTLVQALLGLIAFYLLAREYDLECAQATLLTIGLLACPLFLLFSFSFMTDIPFLAWSILAILLYTRAIRQKNYGLIFAASLACAAAILIRQFGLALVMGILAVWLFQKQRKNQIFFFLTGTLLPLVAVTLQLYSTMLTPNWTAQVRMQQQSEYLKTTGLLLPVDLLWRIAVILQYLALFALPFVWLTLLAIYLNGRKQGNASPAFPTRTMIALLLVYMLATIAYGHFKHHLSWFMPYLPFYLNTLSKGKLRPVVITLMTTLGGVVIAALIARRYFGNPGWSRVPVHLRVLDFATLSFLPLQLVYVQFADRYLLVFLPFTLIVVGHHLSQWIGRHKALTASACFFLMIASALWTRGWISYQEAAWKGGEFVRLQGVMPSRIFGSWEWNCYYTFQNYLDERGQEPPSIEDLYYRWLNEKRRKADYLVQDMPPTTKEWRVVAQIPYRDSFFRQKNFYVMARTAALGK